MQVGKNEKRKLLTDVNAVFEPGMLIGSLPFPRFDARQSQRSIP